MYILVVENDKFLVNAYRVKFEKEGFDVAVVFNGQEAIESIKKRMPDVVLLDLLMPVMDGFSTLKEIRETNGWKDLPVIVASNLGQKEDVDKALSMGATDFVIKTNVAIGDVVKKVREVLSARP